ncbi:MAG: hypothetical protein V4482_05350 [Pseudomonadota bacterium]
MNIKKILLISVSLCSLYNESSAASRIGSAAASNASQYITFIDAHNAVVSILGGSEGLSRRVANPVQLPKLVYITIHAAFTATDDKNIVFERLLENNFARIDEPGLTPPQKALRIQHYRNIILIYLVASLSKSGESFADIPAAIKAELGQIATSQLFNLMHEDLQNAFNTLDEKVIRELLIKFNVETMCKFIRDNGGKILELDAPLSFDEYSASSSAAAGGGTNPAKAKLLASLKFNVPSTATTAINVPVPTASVTGGTGSGGGAGGGIASTAQSDLRTKLMASLNSRKPIMAPAASPEAVASPSPAAAASSSPSPAASASSSTSSEAVNWTVEGVETNALEQIEKSALSVEKTETTSDEEGNDIPISPKEKVKISLKVLIKSNRTSLTIDQLVTRIFDTLAKKGVSYIRPFTTAATTVKYERPTPTKPAAGGASNGQPSLMLQASSVTLRPVRTDATAASGASTKPPTASTLSSVAGGSAVGAAGGGGGGISNNVHKPNKASGASAAAAVAFEPNDTTDQQRMEALNVLAKIKPETANAFRKRKLEDLKRNENLIENDIKLIDWMLSQL